MIERLLATNKKTLRKIKVFLFCLISGWLLAVACRPSFAVDLVLSAAPEYFASSHISYLKEDGNVLSLDDVRRPEVASQFIRSATAVPSFGLTKFAYWFRLELKNSHATQSQWLVEIPTAMFWSAPYYIVRSDGRVEQGTVRHQGAAGFSWRAHPTPVFPLKLAPQEDVVLYFRMQEKGSLRLPLKIWEPQAFAAADHDRQFAVGAFFGVLLAMLAYNLLQFFAMRDRNYVWYVGYIGSLNLTLASFLGYGKEYLWPQAAWWSGVSTLVCLCMTLAFGIVFAQSFLQTRTVLPALHRVLNTIVMTALGLGIVLLWSGRGALINGSILIIAALGAVVLFATGIAALRARVRQARFFVVAWGALLISLMLICLEHLGVIPVSPIPHQALKVGCTLEGLLLSLALADRLQELKRTRTMLRQLGVRQERVREEQRKEIARDLHDKLGQNLLALRMDVGLLQDMTKGAFPRMDEAVDRILAQIDSVVNNVRAIMNNLRPAMLDDLGLYAAIEWQVQEFQSRSGIRCELVSDGDYAGTVLDEPRATALFRSLQEALHNVFGEQSYASKIKVDLRRQGGKLIMTMADLGAHAAFASNELNSSLGLAGMRERLVVLGGDLTLQSDPEHGLRLTISMPLQAGDASGMAA